ncbi:hypothetical protein L3Q82_003892 [Scortum barcoo]|uniref:Uncharacterized protein n=1 Tax=Scortum barcoo TaxID=214431 RepID=A0ACB8X770_9TELE|nr:hypothetical protein L3Q82_003892 [Scortum barcoo]
MQDNARPHVAGVCQQFLQDEGIDAMDWPARSPDLNPIEHIWDIMSRSIHQRHVAPQTVQELADALVQPAAPAHYSVEDDAGYHRVIKHLQHGPADVERSEPPEEEQATLTLLVDGISVCSPVQFIVQVDTQGEDDLQDPAAHHADLLCLWEKMICRILLLITLTSCVCGTFVVNVTQSSYQAEENQNITLEWTFTIKKEMTPHLPFHLL